MKDISLNLKKYKKKNKKYGNWISTQQQNYKNNKQIMYDNGIRKIWYNFINDIKYKKYSF